MNLTEKKRMPAQLLTQYQSIISAILVSVIASFIRLMFYRDLTFYRTLANFFGGVALGMLLGYLLRANVQLGMWKEIIIAVAALFGKELTEGFIKVMPQVGPIAADFLRGFLNNYSNKDKPTQ